MNKTFKCSNSSDYKKALEDLQKDLAEVKKDITYLDVYNITEVCEDKTTFSSKANALAPNSAMVINTEPFFYNDDTYNTGDIILKMANEDTIHIKAQTGGIFYPSAVIKNKDGVDYSIQFSYMPTDPKEPESSFEIVDDTVKDYVPADFAKKITFEGFKVPSTEITNVYGYWGAFTTYKKFRKINSVKPYIKFYYISKNGSEEVSLDYNLQEITEGDTLYYEINIGDVPTNTLYVLIK